MLRELEEGEGASESLGGWEGGGRGNEFRQSEAIAWECQ